MKRYSTKSFLLRIVMLLWVATSLVFAQDVDFTWVKQAGGSPGSCGGKEIATDDAGNVYVTGCFKGTATFETTTLTSAGHSDIFVAKYDASGDLLWVKQAGGAAYDSGDCGNSITVDDAGSVLVTGYFYKTATFETTTLTSAGNWDIFLTKYDASGNLLWVKQAGGAENDCGRSITTDDAGNVFVTGEFRGTATFETTTLTSAGWYDIFVAKYDASGNLLWVKQAGGRWSHSGGSAIATDDAGNVFVTGDFGSTVTFETTTLTDFGYGDIFVAKYDASGNLLWVKQAGGSSVDRGFGVAVDDAGSVLITGYFSETATFETTMLTSAGSWDFFVAKYDASGNLLWVKQAGGTEPDCGHSITTDDAGNVFVTGDFGSTVTFETTTLTSAGIWDILFAKYDAWGNLLWVKQAGGAFRDEGRGITTDHAGNIYVTGYFTDTAIFGMTVLNSLGSYPDNTDIFIAKLTDPCRADPADVGSINAVIQALYASISFRRGQGPNWNRFCSLFSPHACLTIISASGESNTRRVFTFIKRTKELISSGELPALDVTETKRQALHELFPPSVIMSSFEAQSISFGTMRGKTTIVLVMSYGRWWITHIICDWRHN